MIDRINPKVKEIDIPGIRVFANKVAQFDDGINFTIGEPDFPTPDMVKQAGIKAIKDNKTGYSHNAGLLSLREKVSDFFSERYGFYYNPNKEIVITNGASEGIDSILRTILTEGDEVILPAPIYSAYESVIHLSGAKVVYLDTSETNFLPDPKALENLITDRTKAVIFNYPSNPIGVTMDVEHIKQLISIISKYEIFIISDEIYSENTFQGDHTSFASFPEIREQLFLVHGLSKSHAMTGWRVGFVLGDAACMQEVLKVHLSNSICASLPGQYAAIEALTNSRNTPIEMNAFYIERRNFVYKRLKELGFRMKRPTGAFYIFPSIEFTGLSSSEFAIQLLEEEHVAVVPGNAFTSMGEGFIRITYANSMDQLKEGMDRIEQFINRIK